jgi:hypothetical protein
MVSLSSILFFGCLLISFFVSLRYSVPESNKKQASLEEAGVTFDFVLWPTFITPSNTTLNISITNPEPIASISNLSPSPHTIRWISLPSGARNPCELSATAGGYCTIQPAQTIKMGKFNQTGTYQFRDETTTKVATLMVIR